MREICLDTETTGLKPEEGHRIVEIGAVELNNHIPTGRTFHVYLNPERDMPPEAYEVHGLSVEFLSDKPLFSQIAEDFLAFIEDAALVIHNAEFDRAFLNWELQMHGFDMIPAEQCIDTLLIARRKHPMGPNSLDALCKRYGIDNSNREKHGALLDAELLAQVYLELIGGRQIHLSLIGGEEGARERNAQAAAAPRRYGPRPRPLATRLSEEDLKAHAAFVETLGENALWKKYGA